TAPRRTLRHRRAGGCTSNAPKYRVASSSSQSSPRGPEHQTHRDAIQMLAQPQPGSILADAADEGVEPGLRGPVLAGSVDVRRRDIDGPPLLEDQSKAQRLPRANRGFQLGEAGPDLIDEV